MQQSKRYSLLEALANTISGFIISMVLNYYLLPVYGLKISLAGSFTFTFVFTIVTTLRSYVWRRLFNRLVTG